MTEVTPSSSEQHLLVQLEEIRNRSLAAVKDIYKVFFYGDDGHVQVPQYLLDAGLLEALVDVMKREQEGLTSTYEDYYYCLLVSLTGCVLAEGDDAAKREEYVDQILGQGGLELSLTIMHAFPNNALMMNAVAMLFVFFVSTEKGQEVFSPMLEGILFALGNHEGSSQLYRMFCEFISLRCFLRESVPQKFNDQVVHRVLRGITELPHEDRVKVVSLTLLTHLVGALCNAVCTMGA